MTGDKRESLTVLGVRSPNYTRSKEWHTQRWCGASSTNDEALLVEVQEDPLQGSRPRPGPELLTPQIGSASEIISEDNHGDLFKGGVTWRGGTWFGWAVVNRISSAKLIAALTLPCYYSSSLDNGSTRGLGST
jgi:hypothetical protein